MKKQEFVHAVRTFIVDHQSLAASEIPTDANLFDLGLLESFKLPTLVAFLTDQLKLSLDLTEVSMESFYTIDQMYATFADSPPGARSR